MSIIFFIRIKFSAVHFIESIYISKDYYTIRKRYYWLFILLNVLTFFGFVIILNNAYREIVVGWFGTWNSLNALGGIIFTQNAISLMLGFIVVTIINLIFIKYEKARTENLSLVNFMDFIFTQRDRTNARLSKLDEDSRAAVFDMKSYLNELERIIKKNRSLMVYPKEKLND